uniref:F-box domain-containing protein n=1 Tax=Panagrolaimus davidi TaxID=227884 RepID=A0A914P4Q8_9BILA
MESCYFCRSSNHESKECKKYVNNGARKIIADKKKFCRFCFIKFNKIHLRNRKKCPTNEKCVGWYSSDHHIAFCPERVKGMAHNLFLPKIDQNLLQRFVQTFDLEEQFAFGLSSQDAQKYVPLKNIKLTYSFFDWDEVSKKPLTSDDVIAVIRKLGIYDENKEIIFEEITSKKVFWKVRTLKIDFLNISVQELSQLIGSYTKKIEIKKISSNITFAEIVKNAPNIEILNIFHNTWISNQTTWLEDLYKYKEGKNFRELWVRLNNIEFDAETLKKFVETKSINQVFIRFEYQNRKKRKAYHQFVDKMSKLFIEDKSPKDKEIPFIVLQCDGIRDHKLFILDMNKNDGPTLRKRQKKEINNYVFFNC